MANKKTKRQSNQKPPNPHDRFIRGWLGKAREMRKFLRWSLPEWLQKPLNWRTMKVRVSSTFVDERLRERESDLLVEFRTKGGKPVLVYVLWEHQMRVDPLMPWRILCYRVEIWRQWQEENPGATVFPFIYAMVLHQGPETWTAPLDFAESIATDELGLDQEELEDQEVRSRYGVLSVSELPKLGWPQELTLRLGLSLMHQVSQGSSSRWLKDRGEDMDALLSQTGGRAILSIVIEYIFMTDDREKVVQMLKSNPPEIQSETMTYYEEILQEGIEKGIEKGRKEGRDEFQREMILGMLAKGLTPNEVAKLVSVTPAKVRALAAKAAETEG